jgi:hypothetical protein
MSLKGPPVDSPLICEDETMPIVDAPPVFRLYEAISLVFPEDLHMPPGATAAMPPCIYCRQSSPFPPSKMGWAKQAVFVVCETCAAACDDAELERRVKAQLSDSRPSTSAASVQIAEAPPAPLPAATTPVPAAAPKADIFPQQAAAVRPVLASEAAKAWVRAAAREWTQQPPAA